MTTKLGAERKRRGWSQVRVCQLTGIDPATLSRLERGLIYPYPGWREKLSQAFGLPEVELFQLEGERQTRTAVTGA